MEKLTLKYHVTCYIDISGGRNEFYRSWAFKQGIVYPGTPNIKHLRAILPFAAQNQNVPLNLVRIVV